MSKYLYTDTQQDKLKDHSSYKDTTFLTEDHCEHPQNNPTHVRDCWNHVSTSKQRLLLVDNM